MPNYETYGGSSIARQVLANTWLGKLLYGDNTYTDGYGRTRKNASLSESANGQELERIKDTGKTAGKITLTAAGLTNPLTASSTVGSVMSTLGQAYFLGEGLRDAKDRVQTGSTVGDGVMLGLDLLPATSVAKTVTNGAKEVGPALKDLTKNVKLNKTIKPEIKNIKPSFYTLSDEKPWYSDSSTWEPVKKIWEANATPEGVRLKKLASELKEAYPSYFDENTFIQNAKMADFKKIWEDIHFHGAQDASKALLEMGTPRTQISFPKEVGLYYKLRGKPKLPELYSKKVDSILDEGALAGWVPEDLAGFYNIGTHEIQMPRTSTYDTETFIHELHHKIRNVFSKDFYTKSEKEILNKFQMGDGGIDLGEIGATASELNGRFWLQDFLHKLKKDPANMGLKELETAYHKFLDEVPDKQLIKKLKTINGYQFGVKPDLYSSEKEQADIIRELLKKIAVYSTPAYLGINKNKNHGTETNN